MSKRSKSTSEPGPKRKKNEPGRLTANIGVGIVAITAAVISFTHVQHLAQEAGETEFAALLLPLSVDGAIAAAAAVVLAESRAKRRPPLLAWIMLILGLIASLGANIASAEPTLTARLIAAWPPIALALGIEVIAAVRRRAREERDAEAEDLAADRARPRENPVVATPAPRLVPADQPTVNPAPEPATVQPAPPVALGQVTARQAARSDHSPQPGLAVTAAPASASPQQVDQPAPVPAVAAARVPPTSEQPAQPDQSSPVLVRTAAASAGSQRTVQATARTGARRPTNELSDDDAIEVIRRLDAESDRGPVSRRTIETALRCGATRASRLAALARQTDRISELAGQAS